MPFHILWPALEAGWGRQAGQTNTTVICALLGTAQASRIIFHPPCGFALVCSLLLSITQSYNKETSERCPDCRNILKNVLKGQQASGTTQLSSALAPGSGRKLTFHRLPLKLHDDILSQKVSRKTLTCIKEIQAISRPCNSHMSSSQAVWWHCSMRPGCWFWKSTWSLCLSTGLSIFSTSALWL